MICYYTFALLYFCNFLSIIPCSINGEIQDHPSFTIDYDRNTFLKDGEPFRYISGSIHYSRIPSYYWQDRLEKMYAAGLNAIQTYVPWNVHEPAPGHFDFNSQQDLVGFLQLAQRIGLLVILRPGPYICGEWEFGGFPAWLLNNNKSIVLRTMDPDYISAVDGWMAVLLPKLRSLLYTEGGPIISVQVENEYGSYFACDYDYLRHLRNLFRKYLGEDVVLFTTDGNSEKYLKCGTLQGLYSTVDFGPQKNITAAFAPQRLWEPNGPLVNSEFYTGWLDYWGKPHSTVHTQSILRSLDEMLALGANVNMYMFEGGTNFGYMNGADPGPGKVCPTSYDYDAPLSEAGDITQKYLAIRQLISKYRRIPEVPVPPSTLKFAYGFVKMNFIGTVSDMIDKLSTHPPVISHYPLPMEQVHANYYNGFMLYRHVIKTNTTAVLSVPGVRDRGYATIDRVPVMIFERYGSTSVTLSVKQGQVLDILVENQGRTNFGKDILYSRKGIISNVTLDGVALSHWAMHSIDVAAMLKHTSHIRKNNMYSMSGLHKQAAVVSPTIYTGEITVPDKKGFPRDSYLKLDGWFKGQAFVNHVNIGRYWPVMGPQVTLYVPKGVLHPYPQHNTVTLLELELAPCSYNSDPYCSVQFIDYPIINATVKTRT